jgi:hypothetical protein
MSKAEIKLKWQGPFAWPTFESVSTKSFDLIPTDMCGIYLFTVEWSDGYLIYAAGITRRPFVRRFREHTRAHLDGTYTIFDIDVLQRGIRREHWHGFWMKKRSSEKQKVYDVRRDELAGLARKQLSAFRIFVAAVDPLPRILERMEASIMNALYAEPGPVSEIPDRGMMLSPRWQSELPIIVRNIHRAKLHGLPKRMTI